MGGAGIQASVIIGSAFVYLHFPKMAGTKTEDLLQRHFGDDPSLAFDCRVSGGMVWHDGLSHRRARDPDFDPAGRTVVIGMRRLPAWLHSRYAFERMRSPGLPHDPHSLRRAEFLEASGKPNSADRYMHKYLPPALFMQHPVRVVRLENFAADFRSVFGRWLDVSRIGDAELGEPVNRTPQDCPEAREVLEAHRDRIYAASPWWSAVEARFYGQGQAP